MCEDDYDIPLITAAAANMSVINRSFTFQEITFNMFCFHEVLQRLLHPTFYTCLFVRYQESPALGLPKRIALFCLNIF